MINLTVGEMFCGPGGGGLGLMLAAKDIGQNKIRIEHQWATDYDEATCASYRKNISYYAEKLFGDKSHVNVICEDVRQVDISTSGPLTKVDGFIFGFPCNDFSLVGRNKGLDGKFGPLYTYAVELLSRPDKPKWFVAENVTGLSSSNDGKAFDVIINSLQNCGYRINAHKYQFADYGIPQKRNRIVIVGIRDDQNYEYVVPKPSNIKMTARQALENISQDSENHELTKHAPHIIKRLQHIKPGNNAWNSELPADLQLKMSGATLSQIYKRLSPDEPAYTVTGSGGGGTHIYHWEEPRALTNRERARLQTFPDDFVFQGAKESVRKQIGMAIPPNGARVIFQALLKSMLSIEYDGISANLNMQGKLF